MRIKYDCTEGNYENSMHLSFNFSFPGPNVLDSEKVKNLHN